MYTSFNAGVGISSQYFSRQCYWLLCCRCFGWSSREPKCLHGQFTAFSFHGNFGWLHDIFGFRFGNNHTDAARRVFDRADECCILSVAVALFALWLGLKFSTIDRTCRVKFFSRGAFCWLLCRGRRKSFFDAAILFSDDAAVFAFSDYVNRHFWFGGDGRRYRSFIAAIAPDGRMGLDSTACRCFSGQFTGCASRMARRGDFPLGSLGTPALPTGLYGRSLLGFPLLSPTMKTIYNSRTYMTQRILLPRLGRTSSR